VAAGGVVLHRQAGAGRLLVQAQLHPAGVGVPADVGQRLLRGPVERQPRLGAELLLLAGDRQVDADAGVVFELAGQVGQPLRPGQLLVVAQCADGAARVLEAGLGQLVGALHRRHRAGPAGCARSRGFPATR
jgi:hypothetical protein